MCKGNHLSLNEMQNQVVARSNSSNAYNDLLHFDKCVLKLFIKKKNRCLIEWNRCSKNAWINLAFYRKTLLAIALPQSLPVLEMKFTGDTKTYENYVMTSFGMENGILNSLMIYIIKISASAIFWSILIHTRYSSSNFRFLLVLSPGFLLIRSRISIILIQIHTSIIGLSLDLPGCTSPPSPAADFLRNEVGQGAQLRRRAWENHREPISMDQACHLESRLKEFCHGHPTMINWESFVTGHSKEPYGWRIR